LKSLLVALATLVAASLAAQAATAPESVAVLDSLTGDSTIVDNNVVYVDFWASWCTPCRLSFPWMMELLGKYRDKGLQVVAINLDRDPASARKFLDDTHSSLPVVYDPAGKIAKLYDLQVMPTSFVYGRDGAPRLRKEGFNPKDAESVEQLIRALLEEKTGK
jgi:thiol-disulfide isomerase/thioredoxin